MCSGCRMIWLLGKVARLVMAVIRRIDYLAMAADGFELCFPRFCFLKLSLEAFFQTCVVLWNWCQFITFVFSVCEILPCNNASWNVWSLMWKTCTQELKRIKLKQGVLVLGIVFDHYITTKRITLSKACIEWHVIENHTLNNDHDPTLK